MFIFPADTDVANSDNESGSSGGGFGGDGDSDRGSDRDSDNSSDDSEDENEDEVCRTPMFPRSHHAVVPLVGFRVG